MSDSSAYPETPAGWSTVARRQVGPFTTHVTYRQPDGTTVGWSSRVHRKHGSLRSPTRERDPGVWWAPRRASWWIGVLFAVGSACFFVGPFPGFVELVGSAADGLVFFVGSLFFTSAAVLQYLETVSADRGPGATGRRGLRVFTFEPRRIDWWSCVVQVAGTFLFNIDTFRSLQTGFDSQSYDRLVWAPDALGSLCFLVSGYLAYLEVCGRPACRPRRALEWWIAAINLLGCVAFGLAAIGSYFAPAHGSVIDLAAANGWTAFGGLCFLIGSVLLLPESAPAAVSSESRG